MPLRVISSRQKVSQEIRDDLREQNEDNDNHGRNPQQNRAEDTPRTVAFFGSPRLIETKNNEEQRRCEEEGPYLHEERRSPRGSGGEQEWQEWQTAAGCQGHTAKGG